MSARNIRNSMIDEQRPQTEYPAMTRYLFLKADRIGHKNGSNRGVANEGINVRLLQLLTTRYV